MTREPMNIGDIVQSRRRARGMRWVDFEARAGVRQSTVAQWSAGGRDPLRTVNKALAALGAELSVDDIRPSEREWAVSVAASTPTPEGLSQAERHGFELGVLSVIAALKRV